MVTSGGRVMSSTWTSNGGVMAMWNVYRDANGNEYPVARPRNEDRTTLTEFDAVAGQPDQELLSPYAIRIYWRCMAPSTERMSPAQRSPCGILAVGIEVFHAEVLVRERIEVDGAHVRAGRFH